MSRARRECARETWLWFESVTRTLPDAGRQALHIRYAAGLVAGQIGAVLGMTASGVRSATSRALVAIRAAELEGKA